MQTRIMIRLLITVLFVSFVGFLIEKDLHAFSLHIVTPDIAVIIVVAIALRYQNFSGLLSCYLLGLIEDFAAARFVGPFAIGSLVGFAIVALATQAVYAEHVLAIALLTFICSVAKSLTYYLVQALYTHINSFSVTTFHHVFLQACITALLAPLLIRVVFAEPKKGGAVKRTSIIP